jgi:hypothetical protein
MKSPDTGPGATVIPIGVPAQAREENQATGTWEGGYWRQNKSGRAARVTELLLDLGDDGAEGGGGDFWRTWPRPRCW